MCHIWSPLARKLFQLSFDVSHARVLPINIIRWIWIHWKKGKLRNSPFWNVGEKLSSPFSVWGHFRKLGHFGPGMILFFIFTAKKELIFLFPMAPTRSLYNDYFSSYDFLNLFLFFCIFRNFLAERYFPLILISGLK